MNKNIVLLLGLIFILSACAVKEEKAFDPMAAASETGVDVSLLPDITTPTSSNDGLITYEYLASQGDRITERKFSGEIDEFLNGQGSWLSDVMFTSVVISDDYNGSTVTPDLIFKDLSGLGADDEAVRLLGYLTTVTDGAEDGKFIYQIKVDGTRTTYLRMDGDTKDIDIGDDAGVATVSIDSPNWSVTDVGVATFTGTLSGELGVTLDTAATVDLTSASATRGSIRINNDNDIIEYTLPPAEVGLNVCFYSGYAAVVSINPDDGTDTIVLSGVALTAGYELDSPGAAGDFVCLLAIDATYWITLGKSGTWVDGGSS